jgi:uncharacterized membrane protein YdjX (TVP38/TMEM64 family)
MLEELKEIIKEGFNVIYKKRAYIMLTLIAVFMLYIAYEYYAQYFHVLRSPKQIKKLILSYGKYSVFVFFGLQILQVVAFFIPGEVIQVAGGYIYGAFLGGLLSLLGITLGSALVYGIARLFGKPLVKKIISEKHLTFFSKIIKLGSMNYIVFLLYLIPGIPKDVLGYLCGISEISFRDFLLYSTLGRIPGIFISSYFGAKIYIGSKITLIIISVVMTILFVVGVLKGEKIIKRLAKKAS